MKDNLSLNQELKQQQRLTPQQMQLVRMLEMSGPEIEDEVREQVAAMPALELAESDPQGSDSDDYVGEALGEPDNDDSTTDDFPDSPSDYSPVGETADGDDYGDNDEIPVYRTHAHNHSANDPYYEPIAVNEEETLTEHLRTQLAMLDLTPTQAIIAEHIIGNIDSNGYLDRDLYGISDDILIDRNLDVSTEEIKDVLDIVQTLEPAGVGATNLEECLLLQAKRLPKSEGSRLAIEILSKCFEMYNKRHYSKLCARLKISEEEMKKGLQVISHLNPKPGSQFGSSSIAQNAIQIIPEFTVEPEDGKLIVTLLNNIPDLTISRTFSEDMLPTRTSKRREDEARTFIRSHRDEARNFIKTLEMRQKTLFSVMSAIAKIQSEFFFTGDENKLKPMILKDVADATGYDISVISRATASKYVNTIAGVKPLKFFFNERQKSDDDATFYRVANELSNIINSEDKRNPLSDKAITELLNKKGFDIARRTVAKYRERLGFRVARLRREI